MANMSYCRFENTYNDLVDCYHNLDEELESTEKRFREKLIQLCKDIVDRECDEEVDEDDL